MYNSVFPNVWTGLSVKKKIFLRNTARFFVLSPSEEMLILSALDFKELEIRVRPRFFDQVGHETMYASSGNEHFFTKSCHRQTYQN